MIASNFVGKEKLHTYQRWEMDSLETPDLTAKEPKTETEKSIPEGEQEKVAMPTQEEVAAMFRQAREEGYAAGLQEGNAMGYAEGRKNAETEVKAEAARIQGLLTQLNQDLQEIDQQVAESLLDLAIMLARKMVTQALKLKPDLIIPIVQEAIRNLPNAMQPPRLYLHPDDAKLLLAYVNEQMDHDDWIVREDERINRGGCRIEAGGSEINGNLEVRWQRVLSAIGRNDEWLDRED